VRTRILWITGALLAAAALMVALALILGRPSVPFDFLEGGTPFVWNEAAARDLEREFNETWTAYAFEGDYDQVVKAARTELLRKGYEERKHSGGSGVSSAFVPPVGTPENDAHTVTVYEDRRPTPGLGLRGRSGWITVMITDTAKKETFFDRLRSWLGV
jgi:hypothetical protein